MLKICRTILSQLSDTAGMSLLLFFELIVALVAFNISFTSIFATFQMNRIYDQMDLNRGIAFTVTDMDKNGNSVAYEELKKDKSLTVIGTSQLSFRTSVPINAREFYSIQPLSKEYISNLRLPNINGTWFDASADYGDTLPVLVPNALKNKYKTNQTYNLTVNNQKVKIYVLGSLKNDYCFLPPSGIADLIYRQGDLFLTYDKKEILNFSEPSIVEKSNIVTVMVPVGSSVDDAELKLKKNDAVKDIMRLSEAKRFQNDMDKNDNMIPTIIALITIFMCFACSASNNLLSIIRTEKLYAVYYLSGATWKKCAAIQLTKDALLLLLSYLVSFVSLLLLNRHFGGKLISFAGIGGSFLLCTFIFLLTSVFSVYKMSKKRPIDLLQ